MERTGGWQVQRRVSHVYESDGAQDHLVWVSDRDGTFTRMKPPGSAIESQQQEKTYAKFLADLRCRDVRHIGDVRRALVEAQIGSDEWHNDYNR